MDRFEQDGVKPVHKKMVNGRFENGRVKLVFKLNFLLITPQDSMQLR